MGKYRCTEEYAWVKDAGEDELHDELFDLECEVEDIRNQLFTAEYMDEEWRVSAQRASLYKRTGIDIINTELEKRSGVSPNWKRRYETLQKKQRAPEIAHLKALVETLRVKIKKLKFNGHRDTNLVRLLRLKVGEEYFFSAVKLADESTKTANKE